MRQHPSSNKHHPDPGDPGDSGDPAAPGHRSKAGGSLSGGPQALLRHFLRSNSRSAQFLRFGTVGIQVSSIDIGGLYLLHHLLNTNLYLSRVVSLGAAILAGYLLNRYFTFARGQRGCFYRQMAGHFGVHLTGGLINFGGFTAVMLLAERTGMGTPVWMPLFAIVVGGVVGLSFNFVASRHFVFPHRPPGAGDER